MPTYSKLIIAIIIAAVGLYVANSLFLGLPQTEYDFRKAKWGMSPEEVRTSENPELENGVGGNFIFYQEKVAGYDALISYMFNGQLTAEDPSLKLIAGHYDFSAEGLNPDLDIEDFNKIKEFLTTEYGKPQNEVELEVGYGSLLIISWETKSTEIVLSLRDILGDKNYAIDTVFMSKKFKPQIESNLDF